MDDAILTSYQPLTQHKKIGQTHNPESMILLVCCCVFHITWDINVRHLFLRLHCTFFWYVSFVGKAVALWLYYPTGLWSKVFPWTSLHHMAKTLSFTVPLSTLNINGKGKPYKGLWSYPGGNNDTPCYCMLSKCNKHQYNESPSFLSDSSFFFFFYLIATCCVFMGTLLIMPGVQRDWIQ